MGTIKINCAVKQLIEKSISTNHRSMFFLYGKNSTEQVMFLHHLLASSRRSVGMDPPSVLWCFKKKLFTTFNEKRIKKLRKKYKGSPNAKPTKEDIFDHFIIGSGVQFCHYSESSRVLGQTFGFLVLQDFCALTPNTLARTLECVEGGGAIVFLLPETQHPKELFTLHIDAHERFVTEAFPKVSPMFNRRLVLSLASCPSCFILDDQLQVRFLPEGFQEHLLREPQEPKKKKKPKAGPDSPPELRLLLPLCRTKCQRRALLSLAEALSGVVSLTAARGRGKSAVLGLALALGMVEGRCRGVVLTSPHLENLQTLFGFAVKGLEALNLKEGSDFTVERSSDSLVSGMGMGSGCRVRYLPPREWGEGRWADLVVLDEAAAIPLPLIKKWVQAADRVFMASTINGYEGTGRSLSLKLINQLRSQSAATNGKCLCEVELSEAVRYADGDRVECWLDQLLCLHPPPDSLLECQLPKPRDCQLYHVERDLLFSRAERAEEFLQQLVGLFVTSHYNNSPNDLLMMADAPAHTIFCLLSPGGDTVLCVIQVAFEGEISAENCHFEMSHGRRASGDMIPWVISQQFQDHSFTSLRGARVVRIATRPDCQRMGYGQYALDLLAKTLGSEKQGGEVGGAKRHLLTKIQDMPRRPLDYLGVSFGLTTELFRFWKKCGYVPLYIRQTTSEVTGEHTCMMLKGLGGGMGNRLSTFYSDFVPRFLSLVATSFHALPPSLVLDIVSSSTSLLQPRTLSGDVCGWLFPRESLLRLASFCSRQVELAAVADLLPTLARCHLMHALPSTSLPTFQESVLASVCLQGKTVDACAEEMASDSAQVMGALSKAVNKILNSINSMLNQTNGEAAKRSFDERSQNSQRHKKFKNFH